MNNPALADSLHYVRSEKVSSHHGPGPTAAKAPLREVEFLDAFGDGWITMRELAEKVGRHPVNVQARVRKLTVEGKLECKPSGRGPAKLYRRVA